MELKFYQCDCCKKVIVSKEELSLGDGWKELIAGTTEAAREKHIPEIKVEGNIVKVVVGSVLHPMTEEHFIQWVVVETEQGYTLHEFACTDAPEAEFVISAGDKLKAVYAYCNLHGLWKA